MTFERRRADHADAVALLDAYFAELRARLGSFDPALSVSASPDEMAPPHGAFLVAYDDSNEDSKEGSRAVACGGVKRLDAATAEIKRMFVAPDARGRGLGKALLAELEAIARELGCARVVLDTAAPLDEAVALYLGAGYEETPPYNDNPYAARWFAKRL